MTFYIDNTDITNINVMHDIFNILQHLNITSTYNPDTNIIKIHDLLIQHKYTQYPKFILFDYVKGIIIDKNCYSINEIICYCKYYIKIYKASQFAFY